MKNKNKVIVDTDELGIRLQSIMIGKNMGVANSKETKRTKFEIVSSDSKDSKDFMSFKCGKCFKLFGVQNEFVNIIVGGANFNYCCPYCHSEGSLKD